MPPAAISAVGIIGGFVSPWFISYLKDVKGDFSWGMGVVGLVAVVAALALYLRGRRQTPAIPRRVADAR